MKLISEWVKRAAPMIPHEKVFFQKQILQTCQKNEVMVTQPLKAVEYFLWKTFL